MQRRNELLRVHEPWRPPVFRPAVGRAGRFIAWCRRILDLQAASIWRDLRQLLSVADGVVLDVGAGAQPYRGLLPPTAKYEAIDTDEADSNFGYRNTETRYFAGEVWPVATGSVDLVLSTETLEHVPDPDQFLSEVRRVLRPGGATILTVPFSARWHYVPHDYWRFTPSGLRVMLERNGLVDVEVYARGNSLSVAMLKCSALILPFLLSQRGPSRWPRVALGLLLSPFLAVFISFGQLSLRFAGGTDCLGYTVCAVRSVQGGQP